MRKGSVNPKLQRARIGACQECGKTFRAVKDFKDRKQKYCSKECFQTAWARTVRPSITHGKPRIGAENSEWKGDGVGYPGIHAWVRRHGGTKKKCDHCGYETEKKYEWCNKDHKYRRNLEDWMRLCTKCHRKYDKDVLGIRINRFT